MTATILAGTDSSPAVAAPAAGAVFAASPEGLDSLVSDADAAAATGLVNDGDGENDVEKGKRKDSVELGTVQVTGADIGTYSPKQSAAATKLELSLRDTPQSVTVITRQRLDDQNLTSLRQVLDSTTGVFSDAYDSERVLFYSRGFLVDSLLYDGVPAIANFDTGSIDETIDTALYDRIEIVRGATGLMTGAGSPAASINLVRKHAVDTEPGSSVDVSVGSWNNQRVEADASVPLNASGSVRARGVVAYERQDSYQALYHKNTDVVYGIVDWDATPATRLSLGVDHQDNRPRASTFGSFPLFFSDGTRTNWSRSVTTAPKWSYFTRRTDSVFGEADHHFANDWDFRGEVNVRRYREDESLLYLGGFPDRNTGEGMTASVYKTRGNVIDRALDLYARGPFEAFGRSHELVVGYGGSRTSNTGQQFEPTTDLADPGNFFDWDGSYPEPRFSAAQPLNDIDTTQQGLYAASRWSLADPLKLIVGARHDRWNVDSFYSFDTPTISAYDYRKTIPYAGLIYDVTSNYSVFTSYTGIFKPQNARDVNGHYLDPIDGTSVEAGIKGSHLSGRLNVSLTLFRTRQDNVAAPVFDPVTGEPILLPDGSQASLPLDGTTSRGFEAEISGRLADGWQGTIGYSRTLLHDATGAAVRTYIPGSLLRSFVTWTPYDWIAGLTLGGGVNWQSRSSTLVGSPDGGARLPQPSVPLVGLMAKYEFSPRAWLQLNADNVLGRKYYVLDQYDNTYYGAPAEATLSLHVAL